MQHPFGRSQSAMGPYLLDRSERGVNNRSSPVHWKAPDNKRSCGARSWYERSIERSYSANSHTFWTRWLQFIGRDLNVSAHADKGKELNAPLFSGTCPTEPGLAAQPAAPWRATREIHQSGPSLAKVRDPGDPRLQGLRHSLQSRTRLLGCHGLS